MLDERCWRKDGELPDVIALLACSDSDVMVPQMKVKIAAVKITPTMNHN
jgi:hypothetical protein